MSLQLDFEDEDSFELSIDEKSYERAKEILAKFPVIEDSLDEGSTGDDDAPDDVDNEDPVAKANEVSGEALVSEEEFDELMRFVDDATLEILNDSSKEMRSLSAERLCSEDGMVPKTGLYNENVKDECLLPKMQVASQIFRVRYPFVRCIFEQENPRRDRLAHNQNGNGLAQIVNITMKEINKRWHRGDELSQLLKVCFNSISNREDHYLNPIDNLLVPPSYNKSDIFREASQRPPSTRVNPLYRDDSLCLGLMTMGIKVQEARGRKENKTVSEEELARRYNGSKHQHRYARSVVACVERYKSKAQKTL